MGYTTDFDGEIKVSPPLNKAEREYLLKFAGSRRMDREQGPYYAEPRDDFGQSGEGVIAYNEPPQGQPGLWCQWVPTGDGEGIEWDGGEKFYEATEWMAYIIDHFLRPDAAASASGDPQFAEFSFNHVLNGEIEAQGEDYDDRWKLVVKDNEVSEVRGRFVYDDEEAD